MSSEGSSLRAAWQSAGLLPKLAVAGLLLVHTIWICVHLGLVAGERINPWKLGGYGMYTVPHLRALTHVYLFDEAQQGWTELKRSERLFNSYRFDRANNLHVFRCTPPSSEALSAFMDDNPHLRYRAITIVLSEMRFSRDPVGESREAVASVQIAWGGQERFAYQGQVCGTAFQGETDYRAPT
ncbi:MAG: hypothetical protein AAFR17_15030 [Pseudomonadota bacterium]